MLEKKIVIQAGTGAALQNDLEASILVELVIELVIDLLIGLLIATAAPTLDFHPKQVRLRLLTACRNSFSSLVFSSFCRPICA